MTLERLRRDVLIAAAALAGALFCAWLIRRMGPQALVLPVAVLVAVKALARPAYVAGALLVGCVAVEAGGGGLIPLGSTLYGEVKAHTLAPIELLELGLLASIGIAMLARRYPRRSAGPFVAPLLLLGVAVLWGAIVSHAAGTGQTTIVDQVHAYVALLLTPWLFSWVLDGTSALRHAALLGLGLAALKAVAGLVSIVIGQGAASLDSAQLTYYEPTANFLMLIAIMAVLVALLARLDLPRWARWATPLAIAALLLSYRRSWWIGTVVAGVIVILLATGPTGRRLLVPMLLVIVGIVYLALSGTVVKQSQGPIGERLQSLSSGNLQASREDRYRLDERRNVLAELRDAPVTGLGLGVPWRARHPLSTEHPGGRNYTHIATLYWWLKLGPLGLAAYLWIMLTAMVTGVKVFRRHHDDVVRATALAVSAAVAGLMVAELTATWTGIDLRFTIVVGAMLGFLAAARRDIGRGGVRA